MFTIIGSVVVMLSMLVGFIIAGGNPIVLLHVSEFVVIGGMGLGVLIIASPTHVIKNIIADVLENIKGGGPSSEDFLDLMKILYEVFNIARKNGLIAVDEHVSDPASSSIFSKYPSFVNNPDRVSFMVNALRPIIDGKIKPEQLEGILRAEIKTKSHEAHHSVDMLHLIGDSLPGIGIVAAVLGIINTMGAIAEGPEAVGQKVAAALTGTFLGIFGAYGFINPFAERMNFTNHNKFLYFEIITTSVAGFAKGLAPLMAIEVARRSLEANIQPEADELEAMLKELNKKS
jgi:chemotaxis protein MotA